MKLYPEPIRWIAMTHWTPLRVIKLAGNFLAEGKNSKILDIGSGIGKFCLAAAREHPDFIFYGIEQRENLIEHAEAAKQQLGLKNVSFIHANITTIDFSQFNHFYFFNSFYENFSIADKIDHQHEYSNEQYDFYSNYLFQQLENCKPGTRLATYHARADQVPSTFRLVNTAIDKLLQCWIKE